MKILSIIGARPQFVKEAIIQNEIREYNKSTKNHRIEEVVVHTGQHYDSNMSGIFFQVLDMEEPGYNLGIHGATHGEMTGKMLVELEAIMIKENPDVVLLYGDTNSTLAGAIAASKLKIKVAHVEAGLRQEPKDMPEEINRVLTDRVSEYLFAPSLLAVENLKAEGLSEKVHFTGDVMFDIYEKMKPRFDRSLMKELGLTEGKYIVMTLHRDFNVDEPEKLKGILQGVDGISREIPVVLPIHPRTKKRIEEFELEEYTKNLTIIDPVDYLQLMGLTEGCYKVITDSGGYQKESYFAKKPGVVIMPDTSWRELTDQKLNLLSDETNLYENTMNREEVPYKTGIYGDGKAAKKIIEILVKDHSEEKSNTTNHKE